MVFLILVLPTLLTVLLIGLIAFFIKKARWPTPKKKLVFTFISTFLLFPIFTPVSIMAAIPIPNAVFILLSLFSLDILYIVPWYLKTWTWLLPSFTITALILRGIAAMIFYKTG